MISRTACLILYLATAAFTKDSTPRKSDENIEVSNIIEAPSSERGYAHCGARCITEEEIESAFTHCQEAMAERKELESKMKKEGRIVKDEEPDLSLNHDTKGSGTAVNAKEKCQLPFELVSCMFRKQYDLSRNDVANELPRLHSDGNASRNYREECLTEQPQPVCDPPAKYRTITGECNNLDNPTWGMSGACQCRLLPAFYIGDSEIRRSVNGDPLPAPRHLSVNLHKHMIRLTMQVNHLYVIFAQLLDHDLTLTPITTLENEAIQCCPPQNVSHSQCAPILIPRNDCFYSRHEVTCMNFVRSAICPTCELGERKQINLLSSYIDASFVYGSERDLADSLRANDGTGRMRSLETNVGELLPQSPRPNDDRCSYPETNEICFQAGDVRVNEHSVLTSLQTLWLRQHNRIAANLRRINPHWDGETIYQEARRIVGAQMQFITYNEFLPITLGDEIMSTLRLWLSDRERTKYNPQEDASMCTEFTTAAYRFGHSMIATVLVWEPLNSTHGRRLLRNEFFEPFDLYKGLLGPFLRGAANTFAEGLDRHLVPDMTNFIYRRRGNAFGLDLAAINIQRGRDHGLPPYIEMMRFCTGKIEVQSFDDLVRYWIMGREQVEVLQRNYRYVEDVDLWPGLLMEIPMHGAVLGPTGACILGVQFYKLKYGDRFYLEHENQTGSFTSEQLQELRKTYLSSIICLNSDETELPLRALEFVKSENPVINCRHVRDLDLSKWRE